MMGDIGLAIHLLGRPHVERDGAVVDSGRSNKAWGVLAYLLLSERAPTREELVTLLFSEAEDPLATLRWNLNAVRRMLGGGELGGDPVGLTLPPGTFLDVATLRSGSWVEAVEIPGLGCELLEGMAFASSPAFEIWLSSERRHLTGTAEAVLREAALARLARGDAPGAVDLASRLVQLNSLDENFQVLLVRSLADAGRNADATRQAARCTELFRRELGVEPSPALATAITSRSGINAPVVGRAAARAQLDAGEAAIAAGALEAGLECLRRAVADARTARDPELEARGLFALGAALVHAARGRDEEASAALHEVLAIADEHDLDSLAAGACRELGFVEFLQARYDRAEPWLERAQELAGDDVAEQGRIASVLGAVLADTAHYPRALEVLATSCELGARSGDHNRAAYSRCMIGRIRLLRGELDAAAEALDEALAFSVRENWMSFTPWPEALRGDVDLALGETARAADRYEHAFALGCQVGDPCWEGIASRGLGLVEVRRGRLQQGVEWLGESRRRSMRLPDGYVWVDAYALDALCDVAIEHDLPAAPRWVDDLARLADGRGMRELAVRAYLHRARLGDESAMTAARLAAASIDNPTLLEAA
jgi:DNA-binding SARP family transcriptional activator/predicted negative regulator of RcsB-dependent stress response